MSTMRAARFHGVGKPIVVEDRPVPEPGHGEVLVKVAACGVCASDLHMFDGTLPVRTPPPVTPGHESAGTVAAAGPGAGAWKEGDRVVVYAGKGCGLCPRCALGRPVEECLLPVTMGIDYDGAWAEYVVVPATALLPLPGEIPFEIGAIITDAVGTPFNAVVDAGGLRPGERIAIFGIGGLGTHAVQIARLAGASFIAAVDPRPAARERALALGADIAVDPAEGKPSDQIRAVTGGMGVHLALDCVGANAVLKQAVASLAIDGRAIIVGVSGERVQLGPSVTFAAFRNRLRGIMGYSPAHLEALIALVAAGRLDLSGSVSARYPLEQAADAVAALEDKAGDPIRILIEP